MSDLETWTRAEQYLTQRQVEAARQEYLKLRDSAELAIAARMRLSLIAGGTGNFRGAVDEVLDAAGAVGEAPDPHALSMLFKRLIAVGESAAALSIARHPALRNCHDVEPLAEVGKLLSDHGFSADALPLLERAQAKGLSSAPLHFLIGTCRMRLGDGERAEDNLQRGIALDTGFAPNHWQLAKLRRQRSESHHVERLRQMLDSASQPKDRAVLGYALFKELDDLSDYPAAWDAWQAAAAQMKQATGYKLERDVAVLDALHTSAQRLTVPAGHPGDASGTRPLFIVGLPRSGTTLLERLLGGHSDIAVGGELPDLVMQLRYAANLGGPAALDLGLVSRLDGVDMSAWGRRYQDHVQWRGVGKAFITDKLPTNFRLIGWILQALPRARIIHVARDPVAACFSNLRECFFGGGYGYSNDLQDMVGYYRAHRRLMDLWCERFPDRVHRVDYVDLVNDPAATVSRALAHCGLAMQNACLETSGAGDVVATASAAQVREPIHTRSVAHWRNYESQLQPMIDALGGLVA